MTTVVWRRSSRSTEGTSSQCVEVAKLLGEIGIRDSKAPNAASLALSPVSFADLVTRAKRGELSL
ncbi:MULTISPECIES: DUF397 domain-containing protein [Actinomadura]|uniref:DUF397 domain-containing protein n=1 Tax=Actinomadura yumaensis TaxID=111807 RepID=A0ABW2D0X5_9ACTN|nr:DUF397 domain-containing protein [Actinomadura sp. J1-007]MWK34218.1 DUF397 domain-containing protein [Actinomadura sp. J1-007]